MARHGSPIKPGGFGILSRRRLNVVKERPVLSRSICTICFKSFRHAGESGDVELCRKCQKIQDDQDPEREPDFNERLRDGFNPGDE